MQFRCAFLALLLSAPALATVLTTPTSVSFSGNGVTTAFATNFRFLDNSHLVVTATTAGVTTTKTITTHYTVTGAGAATGTVTMLVAPATGTTLTITRVLPLTQTTSLRTQGSFSPAVYENALDRAVMMIQQLTDEVDAVADGELNTDGNIAIGGTLTVTGATLLNSTLGVTGAATFGSSVAAASAAVTGAVTSASVATTAAVTGGTGLYPVGVATGALPACTNTAPPSGTRGGIQWDTTLGYLVYCDGPTTSWRRFMASDLQVLTPSTFSIASSGDGGAGVGTLTPTTSYVKASCLDPENCSGTMGEGGTIVDGTVVLIVGATAATTQWADNVGIQNVAATHDMGIGDTLEFTYFINQWVETAWTDN